MFIMVETVHKQNSSRIDHFQLVPPVASGVGLFVSCLVLTGWALNLSALKSIIPGQPQMVPNTAITFILANLSLFILWRETKTQRKFQLEWICALAVTMIGLLTLAEYLTGADLRFDSLLFSAKLNLNATSFPGRPSPHTALSFLIIGVALLLIRIHKPRAHSLAQILALFVALVAVLALVGYIYQVAFLYSITSYTGMALHTALIFVTLGAGIIFLYPDHGVMSFIMSDSAGGQMVRRLLPATIIIPAVGGGLVVLGARKGLYDMPFGTLLCVWGSILILTSLIWRNARILHRADNKRRQVEDTLRSAYDNLEQRVHERTVELSKVNEMLRAEVSEHTKSEAARGQLLRQLVIAQEEERRRISRELHDQMGQHLNALMLGLKNLRVSCGNGGSPHTNSFRRLQDLTEQLMERTHHLAWELRPAALDDLGLQTALSNYVEKWSERSGIIADFHSHGLNKQRLPSPIETAVYRIVQEALNNVLKHAGANRVSVILELRSNQLLAIVEDDGHGFDVEAAMFAPDEGRGLGLLGIQERVASIGGNLNLESDRSTGTLLVTRIPVYALSSKEGFPGEFAKNLSG
jgi:signal transduction histidine kinase